MKTEPHLDYASPRTPEIETKPQAFKLDLDRRRNLRSLIVLMIICSCVVGLLIAVAFAVIHGWLR